MIVVTGATGFVGRYLIDRLVRDGFDVLATGRTKAGEEYYEKGGIPFSQVDIAKAETLEKLPKQGVDAVVHLAALLSIDVAQWTPEQYVMTNALGTYNILEYCRKSSVRKVVYAMTHSDVNRATEQVITEETPRQFGSTRDATGHGHTLPYIVAKIAGQHFIEGCVQDGTIEQGITFRFPGLRGYGSRDSRYTTVFHQFIVKAMKSQSIEIWGDHKTVRDVLYVKDAVSAIVCALGSDGVKGLYNIGSGKGLTIEDEARAIIKAFSPPDKPSQLVYRPDIEEVRKRSYVFDISKAHRDLAWKPSYTYYEAMLDYKQEMERGYFDLER